MGEVVNVGFNQSADRFAFAYEHGFKVYMSSDASKMFGRNFGDGGIGIVEMLLQTNIVALVGGGREPKYPVSKVMIWDDHQGRPIGELGFNSRVLCVKMRMDKIAVALEHRVQVYDLKDLKLLLDEETGHNDAGILCLSTSTDDPILAYPGVVQGHVEIKALQSGVHKSIKAHNRRLVAMCISSNGKYVATASSKGTIIRIFSTIDGEVIRQVRRGIDPARIWNLAFSHEDCPHWLALTSDRGTVHVFDLRDDGSEDVKLPDKSSSSPSKLKSMKILLNPKQGQLASERSWARYTLSTTKRASVAFPESMHPGSIIVITTSGNYLHLCFDPNSRGHMVCVHEQLMAECT